MKTTQRFLLPVTLLGLITCLAVGVRAQQDEKPATGDGPAAAAKPTVAVSDAEARIAEQLFQEGRKLFFQGKHLESIAKLKKAAETNRSRTGYKLLLAKAHRAVKQDAAATAVLEEIIKANADHVEAGVQLAELLDPTKKPERVIAIVEPLLRLKHTYDLYHLLAEAYYHQEDFNSARKNFEAAVKLNPRNRTDHYQLGNIYLSQKRFARAARSYQTARELGFSSGVFHFKLASVYFNLHNYLGRISTATILGGKAGEVSGDLYYNLGNALVVQLHGFAERDSNPALAIVASSGAALQPSETVDRAVVALGVFGPVLSGVDFPALSGSKNVQGQALSGSARFLHSEYLIRNCSRV